MSKPEHVLLTSLGIQAKVTEYTWRCKSATTRLAPLALMKLMSNYSGRLSTARPARAI